MPPLEDRIVEETATKTRVKWKVSKGNLIKSLNAAANEPGLAQIEPDNGPVIKAVAADPKGGSFDFISWVNNSPYGQPYLSVVDYPDVPLIAPRGEGTRTVEVRTSSSGTSSFLDLVRQKYNGEVLKASQTGDPGSNILIDWGYVVPLMTEPDLVYVTVVDARGWSAPPPAYRQPPIVPEVPENDCQVDEGSTTVPPDTPGSGNGGNGSTGGGGASEGGSTGGGSTGGGSTGGSAGGGSTGASSRSMVTSGFATKGVGLAVVAGTALLIGSAIGSSE